MSDLYLGIDPGLKGGVAFINSGYVSTFEMPVAAGEVNAGTLAGLVREQGRLFRIRGAVIEKVHAMPGQGVCSMFKFGTGYGQVRGVLAALDIPVNLVTPQAWKKQILAGYTHDKAGAIQYCTSRWPSLSLIPPGKRVVHDGIADALCLAAFCMFDYERSGTRKICIDF